MKKIVSLLIAMTLLISSVTAYAAEPRILAANPNLSFDGTTAECSVSCRGEKTTDKITATLTLYQGNTIVDSWSASGTFRVALSEKCSVKRGSSYKLTLTWSVNGVQQSTTSVTGRCSYESLMRT